MNSDRKLIYFDYNATTPLDPVVREAMRPFLEEVWGNPSSVHRLGRQARALLDEARDGAAQVLGCKPSEVVFTSGGTESANTAILGTARLLREKGRHLVATGIEHHAVLHSFEYLQKREGFEVTKVGLERQGVVTLENLKAALRPDTTLVSVMAANNEIGTIQPVAEIGALCRERGIIFHTDAVQWFGKQPFTSIHQFNADLVSICAHKMHGPKGVGALYIRSPLHPDPIIFGGAQENDRRAGTENLANIAGLVKVLKMFSNPPVFPDQKLREFTERLRRAVERIEGAQVVGSKEQRLSNTLAFVVERADSIALLAGLDMEGVCASSGSACSAGSLEPSHVVRALGYSEQLANALVRFSLGRDSTLEEVETVETILPEVIRRVQSR